MSQPIESLLHLENFLKVIESVITGLVDDIIPPAFMVPTDKVIGNSASYWRTVGTRAVAQQVAYGSPSKAAKLKGVSKQAITLLHSFIHFPHDPTVLTLLKSIENSTQKRGVEIIGRRLREFVTLFMNLRKATWFSALSQGLIWFDAEGNLLPTADGAAVTVDFAIPAGHKDQLDWDGNGAIIGATWGTSGTDIIGDIKEIQKAAITQTGYKITHAFYGANIPEYIASNDTIKEYLARNTLGNPTVLKGAVPEELMGLKWIDAQNAFFEDANGVNKFFWGGDKIVFTPDPADTGWWGLIEGSYNVPTDIGKVHGDALSALNSLKEVFGLFGYATVSHDPVGITQYGGDTFLPTINVPKSIFIADVAP